MPLPTVFIKNNPPEIPHHNSDHTLVKPCPGSNNIPFVFFGRVSFIFCCNNELNPPTLNPSAVWTCSPDLSRPIF